MNQHTEEDTYNRLKRSPYKTVRDEISNNYFKSRFKYTGICDIDILFKHGWKYDDYIRERALIDHE